MPRQRRCPNGCGWYEIVGSYNPCPTCGNGARFNKWLRTAELNNHLYESAARAEAQHKSEVAFVKQARKEYNEVKARL